MKPLLMGRNNPDGAKLEEFLSKISDEIKLKTTYIENDPSVIAKQVVINNKEIIKLLARAEDLQRQSYELLDKLAPNEGPLGTPRIGNP